MFYMILGGLLGFWLGVKKKLGMIVDYTLFGILCGLALFCTVGFGLGFLLPRTEGVTTEQEICAFSDSSSTESYNFLFSGYIQDELVYRYVIETERGKHIEEVKDDVYIREGNYKPTVKFHKYGGFKKVIQTCMDTIEKQGKEQLTVQMNCDDIPEEITQAIPVTEPSEYEKIKQQGGNPVFVKPQVYNLVRYVAQERTDNLYRYRKEVPVKERTLKEEFEFWMEIYGEELSYEAEKELKELIEQL